MERTRVHRLLSGFRDRPPAALDEIALVLLKVSQLTIDFGEIIELDINPLLADHEGVLALDARIRVRRSDKPATARLSIRPYPSELEETLTIADGTRFLLRPIRPEDEPLSSLPVSRNCRRNRSACVSSRPCGSCPTAWRRG
jgi:acetyltransferase